MSESRDDTTPTTVNPMITDAVRRVNGTVLEASPELAWSVSQLVSVHATALAVQDAATYLRQVSTVAVSSIAAALAQILAGQSGTGTEALDATRKVIADATKHLERVIEVSRTVTNMSLPGGAGEDDNSASGQ